MTPCLANIYHPHRTLSLLGLPGSNVGWDMPIETENLMLNSVARKARNDTTKYVDELNFLGPVSRGQERLLMANRKRSPDQMKSIKADVQLVAEHIVATLGMGARGRQHWCRVCRGTASLSTCPGRPSRGWRSRASLPRESFMTG